MFKIINKCSLASQITRMEIEAPLIVSKAQAGQFVVVIVEEKGERIPLTLAEWDKSTGSISLIFQEVGRTTHKLANKQVGDTIAHILGPLGHPTDVNNVGTSIAFNANGECRNIGNVVCIGGGVGIAEIFPVSRAFKQAGNHVVGIIGSRNKELLILKYQMGQFCDELHITTDDGSYGRKGFVTDILKEILEQQASRPAEQQVNLIYAIGPVVMMRAVSELSRPLKVKTVVSLNPIMVDATGMCGACRCTVANETKFACVDGPDFDAHQVDFEVLEKRLLQFKQQEQKSRDAL